MEVFESNLSYKVRAFSKGNPDGDALGINIPKKAIEQYPDIKNTEYKVIIMDPQGKKIILKSGCNTNE